MGKFGVRAEKERALLERFRALGIRDEDLVERFVRASGPGGQNVNKVSTAVYLRHTTTRLEVKAQTARSQALNRFLARRLLADRVEALQKGAIAKKKARAEKIRRQKRRRSRRAKARMLEEKRKRGDVKQGRKPVGLDD